jgi:hypothetical protein
MKELETHLKLENKEKIELNIKKKKEIEYIFEGNIKPNRGHFIWEFNEETGEIKKAEFKKNSTFIFSRSYNTEELIIKANCIYIPALNAENAKKKYLKNKQQSAYYVKEPLMNLSDLSFSSTSINKCSNL